MNALNLTLILIVCIITSLSQATQPQTIQSSKLNHTLQQMNLRECSYTALVKTSCSSTPYVRGEIDLLFGDFYGNQIEARQLRGPFEACSAKSYEMYAPCISPICHLRLYMTGEAGLILESITLDNKINDLVTFFYNTLIPQARPFGFNYCNGGY